MDEKEMDAELEKLYSPSQWCPTANSEEVMRDYISETVRGSFIARNTVPCNLDVSYGPSENQKIDIYGENALPKDAPVCVYVHGGCWISGCRRDSSYPVKPLFEAGVVVMILGYDLVSKSFPLPELVKQIQCGIKFILEYAQKRGSRHVFFCGHSAGAHLITMALSEKFPEMEENENRKELFSLIRGIILISGIYDLLALLKTSMARDAYITEDVAALCSPISQVCTLKENVPEDVYIVVFNAEYDSPAFRKQSDYYHEALYSHGFPNLMYVVLGDLDHFSIVQFLYETSHCMSKELMCFGVNMKKM